MRPDRLACHTCATSPLHYLSPAPHALKRGIAVVGTSVFFFHDSVITKILVFLQRKRLH